MFGCVKEKFWRLGRAGAVLGCLLPRPVGAPQVPDSGAALLPVTLVCMQMRMHVDICKCAEGGGVWWGVSCVVGGRVMPGP